MKARPALWLLLAPLRHPDVAYVIPTLAWMAEDAGARLEIYLESERDGRLFAETGSTLLGGHHHQAFNWLCCAFDVRIIRLGDAAVFASSVAAFGLPVLAEADDAPALYRALGVATPATVVLGPDAPVGERRLDLAPYLFPDILFRRALGLAARHADAFAGAREVVRPLAELAPDASWGAVTAGIADRWKGEAKGVVFGDPPAVLSQLAAHCRARRVALYQPLDPLPPRDVAHSYYSEEASPVADQAGALAAEIGARVIVGRQTGDGDIFKWSERGVSIEIIDPNRPVFPVAAEAPQRWADHPDPATGDPSDAELARWADEGRILSTLVVHSGEVAHNEAMLALIELAGWSGLKLGLGAHAARYESCPQTWELLAVPRDRGGAAGLIEPLLHSGGLGVMAEARCPPALLAENCARAMDRIRAVAGPAGTPTGYYAFMDSDLGALDRVRPDLFAAIAAAGLGHIVSSARPGRNRLLWREGEAIALNQSPRVVHGASPFVRVTTREELETAMGARGPGWMIATIDAPVIAFSPYVWREGARFMRLVEGLTAGGQINVLPRTIARYARLLHDRGIVPGAADD